MNPSILSMFAFLAVILAVVGAYSLLTDLFLRDRERLQQRLNEQFQTRTHERAKLSLLLKGSEQTGSDPDEASKPAVSSLRNRLQNVLNQSGLPLEIPRFLAYSAGSAALLGLLGGVLQRTVLVPLGGILVGAAVPLVYVLIKRSARMEALRRQLPDGFDLMARILRAGQSMPQAMQAVSKEFPSPIADDFGFSSEQLNLGLAPEISLRALARRTGLIELNIFVVAVLVQRQVGGNLSEILEKLATVVRDRYRIRGVIQGLTAEGRLQALILMALPVFLFLMMLVVNRDYAVTLLDQPKLLFAMFLFQVLGALWIRKIVNFDF